jgi:hypothetical protein
VIHEGISYGCETENQRTQFTVIVACKLPSASHLHRYRMVTWSVMTRDCLRDDAAAEQYGPDF